MGSAAGVGAYCHREDTQEQDMPSWEYRVIDLGLEVEDSEDRISDYEEILNEMGEDGWELVAVTETEYMDMADSDEPDAPPVSGTTVAYLKRMKT